MRARPWQEWTTRPRPSRGWKVERPLRASPALIEAAIMKTSSLGPLGPVSRLALGGGGIGQVWGQVSRDEAAATLKAAIDGGIDILDTAPLYGDCERLIGDTFAGALPAGVKITT